MALTFANVNRGILGDIRYWSGDVTFDTSYATGGVAFGPAQIGGFDTFYLVLHDDGSGMNFNYDYTNKKLKAFYPSGGGAASPAALAQPATTVTVPAGAVAVTSSAAQPALTIATTPGQGKEALATTDLSTVTVRVLVFGK